MKQHQCVQTSIQCNFRLMVLFGTKNFRKVLHRICESFAQILIHFYNRKLNFRKLDLRKTFGNFCTKYKVLQISQIAFFIIKMNRNLCRTFGKFLQNFPKVFRSEQRYQPNFIPSEQNQQWNVYFSFREEIEAFNKLHFHYLH